MWRLEWESTRNMGNFSAGKFLNDSSFDINKHEENKMAVKILKDFISKSKEEISHVFYGLRKNAIMNISGSDKKIKQDNVILYGLTDEIFRLFFWKLQYCLSFFGFLLLVWLWLLLPVLI